MSTNINILRHGNGRPDTRYKIAQEFIGKEKPQHVLRFCGDFISSHATHNEAVIAAKLHKLGY
jgi:hypothetical protein